MAKKISFRRKAGGSKVGNFLRKTVGRKTGGSKVGNTLRTVVKGVKTAQLKAGGLGGQNLVGGVIKTLSNKSKGATLKSYVGQNLSPSQTTQAYKTVGVRTNNKSSPRNFDPVLGGGNIEYAERIGGTGNVNPSNNIKKSFSGGGTTNTSSSQIPIGGGTVGSYAGGNTNSYSAGYPINSYGQGGGGTSNIINAPNVLGYPSQKLTFPEQPIGDYSKYIPGEMGIPEEQPKNIFESYLASLQDLEAPSSTDAYLKAQKQTQILKKQKLVNDLTGQLNSVVNKGQANQLSLIGQGRGIPEAIIGGQQAQIGRETAIAALPIQAQLSAAQGDLEMANDNLETLFKIYSDDATNEYNRKREQIKMVYDYATEVEKRALERADKLEERAYQEKQDTHDEQKMYAKMAFETGQSSLGARIAKLDYNSSTFRDDLASLSSKIVDTKRSLEIQKLQQDLANSGTTINPKVLTTTQFKNAQAAQNLKLTLQKAISAVEKYGNREVISGEGKGILDSLKVQLRSEISTALEQGVVVPGEAAAFDSIAGQINKSFFIRNKKTLASLKSLSSSMDGRLALQKAALTNTYRISPEEIDTLLNIIDLSDQEFLDMDALIY